MRSIYRYLLLPAFLMFAKSAFPQQNTRLNSIINGVNNIRESLPIEKLYLQTDKDNYVQGDTIWFKGYLVNADYLTPATRSGLLYVELDDVNNAYVTRMLVPLESGLTWGNISLRESDVPPGSYTLRAYTNWMRNFGEDYIFKKQICVAATGSRDRLVTADFRQTGASLQANLLLTGRDNKPVRLQDLELKILNGKKNLFHKKTQTGVDGRFDVSFIIPENTNAQNLSINAREIIEGQETNELTIPVVINRLNHTDLQFMPEGGNLVGGIAAKVGFKAVGEDGKGVAVSGVVYNNKKEKVASFQSVHNGMGVFSFVPQPGEIYTASLDLPGGGTKNYALPAVNIYGTSLQIDQAATDSVKVKISAHTAGAADYYLVAESRGVVCYGAHLKPGQSGFTMAIPKSIFPTGIVRFTLLNAANQPLNERIVFIDRHDEMKIDAGPTEQAYNRHDSIAMQLQVTDKNGKPVRGSFSMAVTDDSQVKTDSLGNNIVNSLLMTSDLKGTVEEPGYYFSGSSADKAAALDALMLTQGWVGYDWKDIFSPPAKPLYTAESQFRVTGRVTNMFNKPIEKAGVILLSKKPAFVKDTVTSKDGRFTFTGFAPVDTAAFVIQARRKGGGNFNVGIELDEFRAPVFKKEQRQQIPWYVNCDTLLLHNRDSKLSQQLAEEKIQGTGTMLKEITIKDKKVIKDSKNLNGPGGADFILDEKDMEKGGKLSLYAFLQKKFPDFYRSLKPHIDPTNPGPDTPIYRLKNHIVNLIIDGVFIDKLELPVDLYMDYLTAEDIKGVEIMYRAKYALAYEPAFIQIEAITPDRFVPIYLEITTYSGNGAFLKNVPGVAIYKPLPFTLPKQFYRPRYAAGSPVNGTDQRSTIHWEPNIVTDTAGCATVGFYSADKPGTYTVIIQGTDLNGQFGYLRRKIVVK
ncbi:carboxypeptidase-like regulatory domain-containing protein [Mucilaginibacter sp. L3T2-6]|uniref:carboxypeptidase-like regulatory domain-containing protein n=1 Tax=Mucilaginibacter sp. L3T2-6 TaxID=3062491 RepID=UPI002675B34A|nr:hypothetical protein [Mucilaginibacter sp. L3T2-6]MDO3643180.1 hypothetical protein [Mucilaginibacter sp. L3T2-6]MDV6215504.1 hypothetical protein [Mucilaginibacter sp. L3T2-6]